MLGLFEKDISSIDTIDIGAGTGIWTRMMYDAGIKNIKAVEPNKDMRKQGQEDNNGKNIKE